jgi:hypothetical protein
MSASAGVLRFVGGKLSKNENAVTLRTPAATIGIRGGIFSASLAADGELEVIFYYGHGLTVTGANVTQTITRPGFGVSVIRGQTPSAPAVVPPAKVAATLAQLSGRNGATGGSSKPPTEASVAQSGISNTVSGDVAASVQQATQNTPSAATTITTTTTSSAVQSATLSLNTIASQAAPQVVQADQSANQPVAPAGNIAGAFKDAFVANGTGFLPSVTTEVPFTGTLKNGVFNATSLPITFTISPLTAGATTNATAPASSGQTASGPAFTSADGNFFFANLVDTTGGGDLVFAFGGTPLQQSFFAPSATTQILAFSVQPDFALANGSQAQTIPFLPSFSGGTLANAVVSPLYVATQPGQAFGNFNALTNPNGKAPFFLQSSLAINGQGASQTSAFVLATGSFSTSTTFGTVIASGAVRGAFQAGGTSPLAHISGGFTTVPGATGNSLFGGTAIDGFVLDQNQSDANGNFIPATASAFQTGVAGTTPYGFNQPVVAASVPSGVGTNRTALNESGYFGGLMATGSGMKYVLAGDVASLVATPSTSQLGATFVGTDPFTSSSTGISSVTLPFGAATGRNFARSAFIDANIFGATESATQPVQITSTSGATFTYPTESGGATTYPALAMVSSGTVPGAANSLLPAGASFCACQFLQWGFWEGNITSINQGGPSNTTQSAYINTWLAGQPTVTLPTSGVGTYNGAAIGTIFNNGATYLAAGGFNQTYNFGANSGAVNITNFDGANYAAAVSGSGNIYSGAFTGTPNRTGAVVGSFYGPGAVETGGSFAIQSTAGAKYLASGIFAGR